MCVSHKILQILQLGCGGGQQIAPILRGGPEPSESPLLACSSSQKKLRAHRWSTTRAEPRSGATPTPSYVVTGGVNAFQCFLAHHNLGKQTATCSLKTGSLSEGGEPLCCELRCAVLFREWIHENEFCFINLCRFLRVPRPNTIAIIFNSLPGETRPQIGQPSLTLLSS
eukprot:SAG11_NODE_839_length_6916_cov_7.427314_4_plen_169_part_00